VEEIDRPQLVGRVLEQLYADAQPSLPGRRARAKRGADSEGWTSGAGDPATWAGAGPAADGVPKLVLVPEMPEDADAYAAFLSDRRGGPVALRSPMRGGKRALMETAARNASEDLVHHRLRRASDYDSRAKALESLRVALGMDEAPLRIECYDMSHLQGTDYVGSMVVLEDGLPRKSEYRHFRIRDVPGNDDYAAMEEVLTRRLRALLEERSEHREAKLPQDDAGERPSRRGARRFAYPPQLLLLDGGKGQLAVGVRVLEQLGLSGRIAVAALAKQFEEVFVPGRSEPLRIPRGSEALFLLQRVRDEAHRFAISYHRRLRGKRVRSSTLDGVQGLGPVRRARLLKEMGSVRKLRQASYEDLESLDWLPERVAAAVYEHLHRVPSPSGRGRVSADGEEPGASGAGAKLPALSGVTGGAQWAGPGEDGTGE